jgi:hypothetical protein
MIGPMDASFRNDMFVHFARQTRNCRTRSAASATVMLRCRIGAARAGGGVACQSIHRAELPADMAEIRAGAAITMMCVALFGFDRNQ